MKLIYSADAVEDLIRLREFIAAENPPAANRVARELKVKIEQLRQLPKLGKGVALSPDPENMRDLIAGCYIIRYQVLPHLLVILRVWHHREDRPSND